MWTVSKQSRDFLIAFDKGERLLISHEMLGVLCMLAKSLLHSFRSSSFVLELRHHLLHLNGFFCNIQITITMLARKEKFCFNIPRTPAVSQFLSQVNPLEKKMNKFQFTLQTDVLLARHAICPPKRCVIRFLSDPFEAY